VLHQAWGVEDGTDDAVLQRHRDWVGQRLYADVEPRLHCQTNATGEAIVLGQLRWAEDGLVTN
jgi:hypothetical protein